MKNKYVTLFILTSMGLCLLLISVFYEKKARTIPKDFTDLQHFNVAVFEPALHPAIDEEAQGFINTLECSKKAHYHFKRYNANGNKTLMRAMAEEIIFSKPDLIFTIGAGCTHMIKELSAKKQQLIPTVFAAVDDPIGMGIVSSLASSNNNLTGVIEDHNFDEQIELLLMLKQNIKTILLVYDPTQGTGLDKYKQELQIVLETKNINLLSIALYQINEIQQKVSTFLPKVDAVFVLKDNTVVSGIDSLIKLCNTYKVTLYASDLNSADKGAALAYGIREYDFGVQAAQKAHLILQEHKKPQEIPITPAKPHKLRINSSACALQNLPLDEKILKLLKVGEII